MSNLKTPWLESYDDVPFHLDYPSCTMVEQVFNIAKTYPTNTALSFLGKNTLYREFEEQIRTASAAFKRIGLKSDDRVVICMPNCPQAIVAMYALNYIGAICVMVHPLSAVGELEYFLKEVDTNIVITLDQFYPKFIEVQRTYHLEKIIIASIKDALTRAKKIGYQFTNTRIRYRKRSNTFVWKKIIKEAKDFKYYRSKIVKKGSSPAIILFSGGTTGTTKGILLTNDNFNAMAMQTATMCNDRVVGTSMLAAMPIFHGFGLGCCIHTMLAVGGRSILVPRFTVDSYAKLIKDEKPNYIAGVPSLYEAMTRAKVLQNIDLSFLKGVFSGGDSLSIPLKGKIDHFLLSRGSKVRVREGYGSTECVSACCLTPTRKEKKGSIGLPYPDTYFKIVEVGTTKEVDGINIDGEICLTGPTVMHSYYNNEDETKIALKQHDDGHTWLHTGDLGCMDEEGYVFFKQRIKRMIITNGYNVYPSHLENVLEEHYGVKESCVIGVDDKVKIQKVKAFVVLNESGKTKNKDHILKSIEKHCKHNIAKYMLPYNIEIIDALPRTKVGKVDYRKLEDKEKHNGET